MLSLKFLYIFILGIDDKHGKFFQSLFPLETFIQQSCDTAINTPVSDHCTALAHYWKNRSGRKVNVKYWKDKSILQNVLSQVENKTVETIGHEREEIWVLLNLQCQMALTSRCEIPYVCERTLLDPTPRSQYLLTHQLFQRFLIEMVDCPNVEVKSFVTEEEIYTNLCAKMYMEAKYVEILDVPIIHRDLFAEIGKFYVYQLVMKCSTF